MGNKSSAKRPRVISNEVITNQHINTQLNSKPSNSDSNVVHISIAPSSTPIDLTIFKSPKEPSTDKSHKYEECISMKRLLTCIQYYTN